MFNFFLWSCFAPGWFWLGFVFVNKPVYSQRWLKYEWQGITVKMTQLMHMCVVGSYITEWECLLMLMTVFPWWGMNITQAGSDWRSAAARHCAVEQALFSSLALCWWRWRWWWGWGVFMRVLSYKSRSCISKPSELPSNTASPGITGARGGSALGRQLARVWDAAGVSCRVLYISVRLHALITVPIAGLTAALQHDLGRTNGGGVHCYRHSAAGQRDSHHLHGLQLKGPQHDWHTGEHAQTSVIVARPGNIWGCSYLWFCSLLRPIW